MIDDFKRPPARKPARIAGDRRDYQAISAESLAPSEPMLPGSQIQQPALGRLAVGQTDETSRNDPRDTPFKTPAEVSEASENSQAHAAVLASHTLPAHTTSHRLKAIFAWRPNRKQAILMAAALVVLISSGTAFALTHRSKPTPIAKAPAKIAPKPAPKPIVSPLTGLTVTAEQQARPVTAVMIENSPDARPQSGLDQAGVVFEAIAEAGITRFMALYQESNPGTLGPVRSSRPYFLDWEMGFDAAYAHVGGSPDALQRIRDIGVKDLDQFYNSGAYHRISSRYAPHNVYTSMDALVGAGTSKGWTKSTYTPLVRKAKDTPSASPNAKSINLAISGAFYNVHYDYDAATNSYKRSEGGNVHADNETKQQLSPKVVIAMATPYSLMADGYHSMYQTVGTGKILVFQDGIVTSGSWSKADPKSQIVLTDDAGKPLALNPGQTWITAVDDIAKATYQP